MKLLEAKSVQTTALKHSIEALKEVLTEANIEATENGLKLITMDLTKTILVHLVLDADNFEHYHCSQKLILGVSLLNFYKLIKTVTNNDTINLFIEESNPNILGIQFINSEKERETTYKLKLMDLNEQKIDVPPAEFNTTITLPSDDFQKYCRDMSILSDTIEIKSVSNKLYLNCDGDFASQSIILGETNHGMSFTKNDNNDEIIQGYFNLKHLVNFTKCTNLCNLVEIYLKNNFPMIIKFDVGTLGRLKLALAPKSPSEN